MDERQCRQLELSFYVYRHGSRLMKKAETDYLKHSLYRRSQTGFDTIFSLR